MATIGGESIAGDMCQSFCLISDRLIEEPGAQDRRPVFTKASDKSRGLLDDRNAIKLTQGGVD
jgi:hypothetical protein